MTTIYLHVRQLSLGLPHAKRPPRQRLGSNALVLTDLATFRVVASLDRKGLGQESFRESGTPLRGVFDKETRRKPLAFAADALSYGI